MPSSTSSGRLYFWGKYIEDDRRVKSRFNKKMEFRVPLKLSAELRVLDIATFIFSMNHKRIPAFLFLLAIIGSVAGCSKSTSPNNSTSSPYPAIGSSFVMTDNSAVPNYDTIVAIPQAFADTAHHGASSVELSETDSSNGGNTITYESFLSNGDLALEGASTGWGATGVYEVLPFVTHTTVIDTFTQSYGGNVSFDTVTAVYSGAGKPVVLNGQTYQTDSVTVMAFTSSGGGGTEFYYTFIPSLGLVSNYSNGYYWKSLTSYSPK